MTADHPGSTARDPDGQVPGRDHDFERDLPGALSTLADTFPEHDPDVIPRGLARGRQLRRVRRLRLGAAACAMAVAVVGGGVAIDRSLAADRSPASRRTLPDADLPTGWPVTGNQMTSVLRSLLPAKGKVSDVFGTGSQLTPREPQMIAKNPTAKLVYRDAGGATGVQVKLSRPAPDTPDARLADCGAVDERKPYDECRATRRPDGSKLTVAKTHLDAWGEERQKHWRVFLDRPDGGRIAVDAYSGGVRDQHIGSDKGTIGIREDPRLSIENLTRIATDARWEKAVTALPTPDKRVLAILESVLPPGLNVTAKGEPEYGASLIVKDARGKSGISANVRVTDEPLQSCAGNPDCRTKTLPDGTTTFAVRRPVGNAPPGFVQWGAGVRYPDGRTVWVDAGNSSSGHTVMTADEDVEGVLFEAEVGSFKPSRDEPVLTLDQLEAMAADPRWTR
ncbi:hypothetical protein [Embleya scabrispora]|uniref:hypothetical protein n=1 Tax=Embleya scabrispora TaxID=159449 RepID=UPI00035E8A2E|nr:hypothetical protein [Embleya scabrispora]MYS82143.1 hypothetical protein [Streptomyces sp. SID5474]